MNNFFRNVFEQNFAAVFTAFGAHVYYPVGLPDNATLWTQKQLRFLCVI